MKKTQIKKIEKKEILKNPKLENKIEKLEIQFLEISKMEMKNNLIKEKYIIFLNNKFKKQNLSFRINRDNFPIENIEKFKSNRKTIRNNGIFIWDIKTHITINIDLLGTITQYDKNLENPNKLGKSKNKELLEYLGNK